MALKKDKRMGPLKPKKKESILRKKRSKKGDWKYDRLTGKGFVNRIDGTCIIEFDSLLDLKMYDCISGELGHICHGAFDESDEPLLGFSCDDVKESITCIEYFRRFLRLHFNPFVPLKRLSAKKGILETIVPKSQLKFLKPMAGEAMKLERTKSVGTTSSVLVSIAQEEKEKITEKLITAKRKAFVMNKKLAVISQEKGLLHCDKNEAAAAECCGSIKMGSKDELPRKICLSYLASNPDKCDGSGETVPVHVTSLALPCTSHIISGCTSNFSTASLRKSPAYVTQSKDTNMPKPAFSQPVGVPAASMQTAPQGTCENALLTSSTCFTQTSSSVAPVDYFTSRIVSENTDAVNSLPVSLGGSKEASSRSNAPINRIYISHKERGRSMMINKASQQPSILPMLSASIASPEENSKGIDKSSVSSKVHHPTECFKTNVNEPGCKELISIPISDDTRTSGQHSLVVKPNPNSIPVIVHPNYLQKLRLKVNEETTKSTDSCNSVMISHGCNLSYAIPFSGASQALSAPSPPHPSLLYPQSDDSDISFVRNESVSIDFTGCDDDDVIYITDGDDSCSESEGETSRRVHACPGSKVPVVNARDTRSSLDFTPNWGVISTSLPEIGYVKVEKMGRELRLYDTAVVSKPLEFANINELKRFLNSQLADFSHPCRNRIPLDWIVVTAGFLRVKHVPPTNPHFWLDPKTAEQTQKDLRNWAWKVIGPPSQKAFIVPAFTRRDTPVRTPQIQKYNGFKNVQPAMRFSVVPNRAVSLPKNGKLTDRSTNCDQSKVRDVPTLVDVYKHGNVSALSKSRYVESKASTTFTGGKSGCVINASNQVSRRTPVVLAIKRQLAPSRSVGVSSGRPVSVKAVTMTTPQVPTPKKQNTVFPYLQSTSKTSTVTSSHFSYVKKSIAGRTSAQNAQAIVSTASVATKMGPVIMSAPFIVRSRSSPVPSISDITTSFLASDARSNSHTKFSPQPKLISN